MTVQQLLSWTAYAHDRHDSSYNDVADKHTICLKQALLDSEPKIETHGYGTSEGERELAIVLIHTCNYNEVCEMENQAYNLCKEPMNIPTNVGRRNDIVSESPCDPAPVYERPPDTILSRYTEVVTRTPTMYYDSDPIPGMPPAHPAPSPAPFMESPLRALSVEESRDVFSRALNSYRERDSDEVVLNQQLAISMTEIQEFVAESMQQTLTGPVAEGCTIPMDLRTASST